MDQESNNTFQDDGISHKSTYASELLDFFVAILNKIIVDSANLPTTTMLNRLTTYFTSMSITVPTYINTIIDRLNLDVDTRKKFKTEQLVPAERARLDRRQCSLENHDLFSGVSNPMDIIAHNIVFEARERFSFLEAKIDLSGQQKVAQREKIFEKLLLESLREHETSGDYKELSIKLSELFPEKQREVQKKLEKVVPSSSKRFKEVIENGTTRRFNEAVKPYENDMNKAINERLSKEKTKGLSLER